eukprot:3036144-Rhodomonas_salina.2
MLLAPRTPGSVWELSGQLRHASTSLDPRLTLKVCEGHMMHGPVPCTSLYWPGAHCVQRPVHTDALHIVPACTEPAPRPSASAAAASCPTNASMRTFKPTHRTLLALLLCEAEDSVDGLVVQLVAAWTRHEIVPLVGWIEHPRGSRHARHDASSRLASRIILVQQTLAICTLGAPVAHAVDSVALVLALDVLVARAPVDQQAVSEAQTPMVASGVHRVGFKAKASIDIGGVVSVHH